MLPFAGIPQVLHRAILSRIDTAWGITSQKGHANYEPTYLTPRTARADEGCRARISFNRSEYYADTAVLADIPALAPMGLVST